MDIKNKKIALSLIIIFVLGIFLRTYNFSELLRFNPDQARDATLARDVLAGEARWPLLGPQAGGTDFKLGAVFYHIQILSAKIFGAEPEKLAYPDLWLSILTIPFLYVFLRNFFSRLVALSAVAVFAVSFYAIKYARFAWNPNSTPFYVLLFLYSLHKLADQKEKRKWIWAVLLGVAVGVGVQLHSLLLFSFPIVFILYFAYLCWRKNRAWRFAPLVILVALVFNTPQIMSEFQTGGKNFQSFSKGLESKSSREGSLPYKFVLNSVCHIQANSFMLLPIGNSNECDFIDARKNIPKNKFLIFQLSFAAIFSLGGYFLLFQYWRKEKEERRKNLLGLILLYSGTLFVILIPLAVEISFRFFLVLEFMPFLLLALWLKFLSEKFSKLEASIVTSIAVSIMAINTFAINQQFSYLEGKTNEGRNGFEEITLGEVKFMADFISSRAGNDFVVNENVVYLDGKARELFKIIKPIKYYTDEEDLGVEEFDKKDILGKGDKLFLIDIIKNPQSLGELSKSNQEKYDVLDEAKYRRVRIYEVKNR